MSQIGSFKLSYDKASIASIKAYNVRAARLIRAFEKSFPGCEYELTFKDNARNSMRTVTYKIRTER